MSPVAFKARLAVGATGGGAGGGGPDGTDYYVEVTIASSQVASTLTDFPVYVDLSDLPAGFFSNVQSDGGDIRVTESDGTTRCPVDLVSINTGSSTGELHFLASSLSSSSDTTFRVYYGSSSTLSQPGVGTTYGRNAVWSNYIAVYHLEDDPTGGTMTDSAGNADGTVEGSPTSVTGHVGDALSFDFSSERVDLGDPTGVAGATDLTISAWVNNDSLTSDGAILGRWGGDTDSTLLFWRDVGGSADSYAFIVRNGGTVDRAGEDAGSASTSGWQHAVGVFDGGNAITVYTDGSQSDTASASNSTVGSSTVYDVALATDHGATSSRDFDGDIDEVRLSAAVLSSDWIASEYTNQNSPTTFYTIGSQTAA